MIVFRLSKCKYASDHSGRGAEKSGGRWNSKGTAVIYTSESRALCTTEIAVHTGLGILPTDYCLVTMKLPDNTEIKEIQMSELQSDWTSFPATRATQLMGDSFIDEEKYLALKVPSAIVSGDFNFLINPHHKDFKRVKILKTEPFSFNERLFVR